ncbi:MAG TPA: metallophosphoesterase [Kofleriaceae bacterium]|jgi:serine/threonine protein phosphatase 1
MRTLIIGDIHGCYSELLELFDAAALGADDVVVSVGDLVDRGPDPAGVVRWFRARKNAVVLMGNHERKHVREVFSYSQEVTRVQMGDEYAEAVAWMRGLPYFYETPEVRAVHAACIPGTPLAETPEEILSGTTSGEAKLKKLIPEGWWHEHYTDEKPIVFGHHVTGPDPLLRDGKVFGLDTGCVFGHRLTALSVPDMKLYSVPSSGDHWKAIAQRHQVPVLRSKPWATMGWAKLAEAVAAHEHKPAPDTVAFVADITHWVEELRALIKTFRTRVEQIDSELRSHGEDALAAHPAKALLFKLGRGRLTDEDIEQRCASPQATLQLAKQLGVDTSGIRSPV